MPNELGKLLRTLRIEKGERLADMADKVGVSIAFLSAIETNRKDPPVDMVDRIGNAYRMNPKQRVQLELALFNSKTSFKLEPETSAARDTVAMLARRLNRLGVEEHKKIQAFLRKDEDK